VKEEAMPMLRGTLSKAMWVGRGAAAVFGLALVLALVMGAATMALAVVPGDPFRLGQTNGIDQISTLVGNAATPMLRIDNGSTAAGATALDLRVEAGKPPMKVNSVTKVAKLNADTLDGEDSTGFYAAGSKVADSAHADQADSATDAQNASNADTVDGKHASDFAAAYERTVVVSPVGTDAENGTALLDAITNITAASASKPYLLHIEPATYDLGDGSLGMKEWVDIEGSGELNTVITSGVTNQEGCDDQSTGTVIGANNAEMRFLTVRNTGVGECQIAISNNSASPRLTHLTAQSTGEGGTDNIAVLNSSSSSTIMIGVTATASGATQRNTGVLNSLSSPTMIDVTATASGSSAAQSFGVFNGSSSPTIRHSKLSASGPNSRALSQTFGTTKIALTQLVGGVANKNGTLTCAGVYDGNFAFFTDTCPPNPPQ
jgi:hypothetical protein